MKIDTLSRRVDRMIAQIDQPVPHKPLFVHMDVFSAEEQATIEAMLATIGPKVQWLDTIGRHDYSQLTNDELDLLYEWAQRYDQLTERI